MYHYSSYVDAQEPSSALLTQCPFFNFLSTLVCSVFISLPFWYGFRKQLLYFFTNSQEDDGSSSSDETNEEEDTEDYSMHYRTEYELLEDRELSQEDMTQLQDKFIIETTDFGDIVMMYNEKTESFWYYTDQLKEVSYTLLEAIARKYVVEYKCKRLYLNGQSSSPTPSEDTQSSDPKKETQPQKEGVAPYPYAKFKKYNTGKVATLNFKTGVDVVEQTNHFRYKGKLYECKLYESKLYESKLYESKLYETENGLNVKENQSNIIPSMTYAEFKKLVDQAKKEN